MSSADGQEKRIMVLEQTSAVHEERWAVQLEINRTQAATAQKIADKLTWLTARVSLILAVVVIAAEALARWLIR